MNALCSQNENRETAHRRIENHHKKWFVPLKPWSLRSRFEDVLR